MAFHWKDTSFQLLSTGKLGQDRDVIPPPVLPPPTPPPPSYVTPPPLLQTMAMILIGWILWTRSAQELSIMTTSLFSSTDDGGAELDGKT